MNSVIKVKALEYALKRMGEKERGWSGFLDQLKIKYC
jgi:hypothetical protein